MDNEKLKKRMKVMLIVLAVVFGCIFGYKQFQKLMMYWYMSSLTNVVAVSSMKAGYSWWQPKLTASGSIRAIRGVNVTTELAGMVQGIYFTPGAFVNQGTVLVQLNADTEVGALHALQASAELARLTYMRDAKQYAAKAISKQILDNDVANFKNLIAQVAEQSATVIKKNIRAPFTGRLGISAVNPGQYMNPGDKIVSLQSLDPIYADFYVPQQSLVQLKVGQSVSLLVDAFPKQTFTGKITTIDSAFDVNTRNVEVEATIANPQYALSPGMFVTVDVTTSKPERYITLPTTAIVFNSYGKIVYVVQQKGKDKKGKPMLIANQVFVTTGETRGDQISILKGLKEGDMIVTSGQLKLKNGDQISINNSIVPSNSADPHVSFEG